MAKTLWSCLGVTPIAFAGRAQSPLPVTRGEKPSPEKIVFAEALAPSSFELSASHSTALEQTLGAIDSYFQILKIINFQ